jgi:hypothetical protein
VGLSSYDAPAVVALVGTINEVISTVGEVNTLIRLIVSVFIIMAQTYLIGTIVLIGVGSDHTAVVVEMLPAITDIHTLDIE